MFIKILMFFAICLFSPSIFAAKNYFTHDFRISKPEDLKLPKDAATLSFITLLGDKNWKTLTLEDFRKICPEKCLFAIAVSSEDISEQNSQWVIGKKDDLREFQKSYEDLNETLPVTDQKQLWAPRALAEIVPNSVPYPLYDWEGLYYSFRSHLNIKEGNWAVGLADYLNSSKTPETLRIRRIIHALRYHQFKWSNGDIRLSDFFGDPFANANVVGHAKFFYLWSSLGKTLTRPVLIDRLKSAFKSDRIFTTSELIKEIGGSESEKISSIFQYYWNDQGISRIAISDFQFSNDKVHLTMNSGENPTPEEIPVLVHGTDPNPCSFNISTFPKGFDGDLPCKTPRSFTIDPDFEIFRLMSVAEAPKVFAGMLASTEPQISFMGKWKKNERKLLKQLKQSIPALEEFKSIYNFKGGGPTLVLTDNFSHANLKAVMHYSLIPSSPKERAIAIAVPTVKEAYLTHIFIRAKSETDLKKMIIEVISNPFNSKTVLKKNGEISSELISPEEHSLYREKH